MLHYRQYLFFLSALVVSIAGLCSEASASVEQSHVVGAINGKSFTAEDLCYWMKRERSGVYRYFFNTHGVTPTATFWSPSERIAGKCPVEELRKRALRSLVEADCLVQLGHQNDLIDAATSHELHAMRGDVNAAREQMLKKGQVIYGPKSYSNHVFHAYVLSNLKIQLEDLWNSGELMLPETQGQQPASSFDAVVDALSQSAEVTTIEAQFNTIQLP